MDEVAKTGKPLFGHVPDDSEAFDYEWTLGLGMDSIEHLEKRLGKRIVIQVDSSVHQEQFDLVTD